MNIEELAGLMSQEGVDKDTYNKLLKAAEELENEKKADRQGNGPKARNQFLVVLKSHLDLKEEDIVSHVFTAPAENFDPCTLLDKVRTAAVEQNSNSRKKKSKVESFDEVTKIKRKYLKPENILLKTKEDWVRVIVLPKDVSYLETPAE